jgi:hypothetical protein
MRAQLCLSSSRCRHTVDIACVRARDGRQTTLHAELGDRWALVTPGPTTSDEPAAVVAKRFGDDRMEMT